MPNNSNTPTEIHIFLFIARERERERVRERERERERERDELVSEKIQLACSDILCQCSGGFRHLSNILNNKRITISFCELEHVAQDAQIKQM